MLTPPKKELSTLPQLTSTRLGRNMRRPSSTLLLIILATTSGLANAVPPTKTYTLIGGNGTKYSSPGAAVAHIFQEESTVFNDCMGIDTSNPPNYLVCTYRYPTSGWIAAPTNKTTINGEPTWINQNINQITKGRDHTGELVLDTDRSAGAFGVDVHFTCPKNTKKITGGAFPNFTLQCEPFVNCEPPAVYNDITGTCENHCGAGTSGNQCAPEPSPHNCNSQSGHPINFSSGEKLRREIVITTGNISPISFYYFYNNFSNQERLGGGSIAAKNSAYNVSATHSPLSPADYERQYQQGHYGDNDHQEPYWRHSFSHHLLNTNGQKILSLPNGDFVHFTNSGVSSSHPEYSISITTNGHLVEHSKKNLLSFNTSGYLTKIIDFSTRDTIDLEYESNLLTTLKNSKGNSLNLSYQEFEVYDFYKNNLSSIPLPTKITSEDGKYSTLSWEHSSSGVSSTQRMLTRITHPSLNTPSSGRDFTYSDARWPASLTAIHDVSDIEKLRQVRYAEFRYDDQGRAIYSSLAGGADATTVNYVDELTRTVTNALGKDATYTFAMVDGVKRLKKVVGEPTTNCLQSEVEYIYNTDGTVFEKHQNGKVTRYTQYDNKGRELERTEAKGTPNARTIKTEWHPTLNVKTKVIEPKTTTVWEYFDDGKLKATKTYATAIN